MKNPTPHIILVDSFCGAGGVTTGARMSGVCRVVAGINHDPVAIASHAANHPDTHHFIEDVRTCPLDELVRIVSDYRRRYPRALVAFWASLECTQFSKAKGGQSREADSRMLAWALPRYIKALNPDLVQIENVEEFMGWGDLDTDGKPISRRQGREYLRWVKHLCGMGYLHDWRMLTAADFGAYTTRERYFGVFHKPGVPHAWPQPTHAKRAQGGIMFADTRAPWKPVSDVLDFSDLGRSIFDRKPAIVDKTLLRILKGLKKYINQPLLMTCNTPGYCSPLNRPAGVITTRGHKAIVTPLIQTYYSNGSTVSMNEPAKTITTRDRMSLVTPVQWIDRQFSQGGTDSALDAPAGSILTTPKMNLVSAFLTNHTYDNAGTPVTDPAPTILASRRYYYLCNAFLVNPQYSNNGNSVLLPAPTVIASQKSNPLGLAVAERGEPKWPIQPGDSEAMRDLKNFMRENQVADIYMRMLHVAELKAIQGFPASYVLKGTQEQQKKFLGNAVVPEIVSAWMQAIAHNS